MRRVCSYVLRNTFAIGLLLFLSLSIISQFIPTVNATFTVTEQSDRFVVENDYFIAHIPNSTSVNGAGTIAEMYVKPQTSINIVSHTSGFCSLIGAEFTEMNGTNAWGYSVWTSWTIHSLAVSKVAETQSYATIMSEIVWQTETFSSTPNHTLVIYMTFFDQPYYLVTLTRAQQDDYAQIYNSEICFLYDTDDFWDWNDGNDWFYASNRTGHAEQAYTGNAFLHESSIYGKFPWFWVYNETMGVGHGTILIDSTRPMETTLGNLAGGTPGSYSEYQINIGYAERIDEPLALTFIGYARGTTDNSYIDSLATQLYESRKTALTSEDYNFPLMMNYKHNTGSYNKFGRMNFRLRPIGSEWGFGGWDTRTYWQSCNFYYVNATGSYSMFNWADVSVPAAYQNGTYATVTWNRNYENKLEWTAKFEMWDDSDTMKLTLTLETIGTVSITDAYFRWFSGRYSDVKWFEFSGESSYIKLNTTDVKNYVPSIIKEEGYMVKNLTNTPRNIVSNSILQLFWARNTSDVEYSAGESWSISLYIEYFKLYKDWHSTYFGVSNFTEPSAHESFWETINYQSWLQLPLFSQESDLAINRIGTAKSQVAHSTFGYDQLALVFIGENGITTTRQIYCGDKGEPTTVTGATSWSYNSEMKIATVNVLHTNSKEVVIFFWGGVPEFPLGASMEISLITVIILMGWKNRRKISCNISR